MDPTTLAKARRRRAATSTYSATRWTIALASLAVASCAIEGDEACGKNQVYTEGSGILDYAVCVCDEARGYVFDTQRGYGCKRCAKDEMAEGGRCVGEMADAGAGGSDSSSPPPEPTGAGEPCTSHDECAGFDASYCGMGSCLVQTCATGENACGSDTACCDYSALSTGFSLCLPTDLLESGNCPMGGMKVDP
jgi:hypothetical protein